MTLKKGIVVAVTMIIAVGIVNGPVARSVVDKRDLIACSMGTTGSGGALIEYGRNIAVQCPNVREGKIVEGTPVHGVVVKFFDQKLKTDKTVRIDFESESAQTDFVKNWTGGDQRVVFGTLESRGFKPDYTELRIDALLDPNARIYGGAFLEDGRWLVTSRPAGASGIEDFRKWRRAKGAKELSINGKSIRFVARGVPTEGCGGPFLACRWQDLHKFNSRAVSSLPLASCEQVKNPLAKKQVCGGVANCQFCTEEGELENVYVAADCSPATDDHRACNDIDALECVKDKSIGRSSGYPTYWEGSRDDESGDASVGSAETN